MIEGEPTPFTVLKPIVINEDNLVSINVAEDDYPAYNPATSYAVDARVMVIADHSNYQSLVSSNVGNTPSTSPTKWVRVGPTNKWAAFDASGGTVTNNPSTIEFVISADRIDSMVLMGLQANSVRIQAYNVIDGTYLDEVYTLDDSALIGDWYAYFYTPVVLKTVLVLTDIPGISNSTYTITVISEGTASLGTFVMGQRQEFGFTQYGATAGIKNYGRTRTDEFGNTEFIRRSYAKTMNVEVEIDSYLVDAVYRTLSELRDTAAVYIATGNDYEMLTIYGRFTDFSINVAYPTSSNCSIQIEGLV